MKKNIDTQTAIEIFKSIIDSENKSYGIDVSFVTIKLRDLLRREISKKTYVLDKIIKFLEVFFDEQTTISRYYPCNNEIIFVFDKKIIRIKENQFNSLDISITAYHEFFHALDERRVCFFKNNDVPIKEIDFTYFCSIIEDFISNCLEIIKKYQIDHDGFMTELQAEMYAILHVKTNDINEQKTIKKIKKYLNKRFDEYDFDYFLSVFLKNYKLKSSEKNEYNRGIFKILFKNGEFNNLNDMIKNPSFGEINPYLLRRIITSLPFLQNIINSSYKLDNYTIEYLKKIIIYELSLIELRLKNRKGILDKITIGITKIENFHKKLFRVMYDSYFYGDNFLKPVNMQLSKLFNYTLYIPEIDSKPKIDKYVEKYALLKDVLNKLNQCLMNNSLEDISGKKSEKIK